MLPFKEPAIPTNFTKVNASILGVYHSGHDQFKVNDNIHLVRLLHRNLTRSDDFFLGVLTVLIIAILSDIAHSIILRSLNRRVPTSRILSAFLVSELSHMRNVLRSWKLALSVLRSRNPHDFQRLNLDTQRYPSRIFVLSFYFILCSIILFTTDVLAVVFTQQSPQQSSSRQYNLLAFHPSSLSNENLSRYIRRLTGDRPCASPIIVSNSKTQTRRYHLISCGTIQFGGTENPGGYDESENVSIESFYHRGGSDHKIYYGAGFLTVSVRVHVVLDENDGGVRRLLFQSLDDASFSHAQYLQELAVKSAKDWLCKREGPVYNDWCKRASKQTKATSTNLVTQNIYLWQGRTAPVYGNVTGILSVFNGIDILNATGAFNSGLRALLTSSYVKEVVGMGAYEREIDDIPETGVPGLLAENSRVTGVLLLTIVFGVLFIVKMILRSFLHPVSLGEIVLQNIDEERINSAPEGDTVSRVRQINPLGSDDDIGTGSLTYRYNENDFD